MTKVYVLDAGALLSNWTQKHPDYLFVTTYSIIDELQNKPSQQRADNLVSTGRLSIESPAQSWIKQVASVSSTVGDGYVLSDTDKELIALALELKNSGKEPVVVSTDLAVLNTASNLDLLILDPKNRMKHVVSWILKCPACNNEEPSGSKYTECPVCGTEMYRKTASRKKVRKSE